MEIERIAGHVAAEIDDLLATLPLVTDDRALTDRLFGQLVDLLLEGIVADLRFALVFGEMAIADYGNELAELAEQCRRVGLLAKL
jgi:hypothetical protein